MHRFLKNANYALLVVTSFGPLWYFFDNGDETTITFRKKQEEMKTNLKILFVVSFQIRDTDGKEITRVIDHAS